MGYRLHASGDWIVDIPDNDEDIERINVALFDYTSGEDLRNLPGEVFSLYDGYIGEGVKAIQDETGRVVRVEIKYLPYGKYDDREDDFRVLAEFSRSGSRIEFVGEDDERWMFWKGDGYMLEVEQPQVLYPRLAAFDEWKSELEESQA